MTSNIGSHLTPRQREVLCRMLDGATARQIATDLSISTASVHSHLRAVYSALGVNNRARAVIAALEAGYGQLDETAMDGWTMERDRIRSALEGTWKPCGVHPQYCPDCAACAKAATLTYAILLVRDPWAAHPGPPPAVATESAQVPRDSQRVAPPGPDGRLVRVHRPRVTR